MTKEKQCPVCESVHRNLTLHIRKYAMSEAFNKEFVPTSPSLHLDHLKKHYKQIRSDEPFILIKDKKVKIMESVSF